MCEFQSLYFNDDGYVVRCKQCNYYQLAFGSTMLLLTPQDFTALYEMVKYKCAEQATPFSVHTKSVLIPTNSHNMYMLLTQNEVDKFNNILEEADNEAKAQDLLGLFDL